MFCPVRHIEDRVLRAHREDLALMKGSLWLKLTGRVLFTPWQLAVAPNLYFPLGVFIPQLIFFFFFFLKSIPLPYRTPRMCPSFVTWAHYLGFKQIQQGTKRSKTVVSLRWGAPHLFGSPEGWLWRGYSLNVLPAQWFMGWTLLPCVAILEGDIFKDLWEVLSP